jgi:hypothetical protein
MLLIQCWESHMDKEVGCFFNLVVEHLYVIVPKKMHIF